MDEQSRKVNGYDLFPIRDDPILNFCFLNHEVREIWSLDDVIQDYSIYEKYIDRMSRDFVVNKVGEKITLSVFRDVMDYLMCRDWGKVYPNGDSVFKKINDGVENVYIQTMEYKKLQDLNIDELFKLPYPKNFIFFAVQFLCKYRNESVKYLNSFCYWVNEALESKRYCKL